MKRTKKFLISLAMAMLVASPAHATWQEEMDLLTAGAAASVVAMHSCRGQMYSDNANQYAATKLRRAAMEMEDSESAYKYAQSSFEIKVSALWQSSQGDCSKAKRLIDMAKYLGFLAPPN
ncbi:hypothetical protein DZC30_18860 [Comamonas testosteroni]|uniref:Uncharacterized protein n=1 Tax=Comamonas testosteroni TaxID=285 RepID=A0A373FBC1_COMTE|nr:hypothetical protein [Comamonas testosteroni]RGE41370.1 hypothetical protein DZC30_18860 [Comamonas testosteroni]